MIRSRKRWILAVILTLGSVVGTVGLHSHLGMSAPGAHMMAGDSLPPPPDPLSTSYQP